MRRLFFAAVLAAFGSTVFAGEIKVPEKACFGTTLEFLDTPKDAAAKAKKDEKLVFILHVSGNFEDPRFT